jgi:hypothetical protein
MAVYAWGGSPIFGGVSSPMAFWDSVVDDGDMLHPLNGAVAAAGFTSTPASNRAAVVVGNGRRTIANGFLFMEINPPADAVQLAANEIQWVAGTRASRTNVAYLRSTAGVPWDRPDNEAILGMVFGTNWQDLRFETANASNLLSTGTGLIFLEGSDQGALEMGAFRRSKTGSTPAAACSSTPRPTKEATRTLALVCSLKTTISPRQPSLRRRSMRFSAVPECRSATPSPAYLSGTRPFQATG